MTPAFAPPDQLQAVQDAVLAMPVARTLKLAFRHIAPGEVELEIPAAPEFSFRPGQLQATAIFAVADFAAVAAAGTLLPPGASVDTPPTKLQVNTPITIATSFGLLNALTQNQSPGIALVADFVAEPAIADGRLASVLPDWELAGSYAPRTAYAVYAPGPHVPPKLRAMLDFLTSECERK